MCKTYKVLELKCKVCGKSAKIPYIGESMNIKKVTCANCYTKKVTKK